MTQNDKPTFVAVPKTFLYWVYGVFFSSLFTISICMLTIDGQRYRWWGLGVFAAGVGLIVTAVNAIIG